jgi:hypothetical protein
VLRGTWDRGVDATRELHVREAIDEFVLSESWVRKARFY